MSHIAAARDEHEDAKLQDALGTEAAGSIKRTGTRAVNSRPWSLWTTNTTHRI